MAVQSEEGLEQQNDTQDAIEWVAYRCFNSQESKLVLTLVDGCGVPSAERDAHQVPTGKSINLVTTSS